ncbi:MAG: hypothetical protein IJH40_01105 [Ruminococcus sp.]|uniref:alpha-amylase family glycosyl hydrolase n=1 Tax=Ruminococcus sp. TaxID=41978 RepID=UPI002873AA4A|nr:alpha-amylase family glycosyl hydrolase [Ruminococcus sp.]MBQ3284212.1 hypothetical protein [Ruminococcus sp.]
MKRRMISLLLAICMILTCVISIGFSVSAQDTDIADSGTEYGLPQSCADGNILQCFNWTLSQIKAELPNIAAAGFTSVQTSPLQPHDGSNKWYWLYQPTNFTIGNELGSYSDLQSLCTEADKYGVKIIVDVVSNHVAGSDNGNLANSVDSVFKNNKSAYFHNLGSHGSDDGRYATTQKNWGMPDLKSENTNIQNMVYNMVVSLKDAGVDGVRWDAAKHIALPSEDCGFWSKMAQIDIYQYGEILGKPADGDTEANNKTWINEYADYIGVSDTVYSAAVMSAVRDSTTYKTTGYWSRKGVDAGKIVNWAESHDSYANEVSAGGWTKNLDQGVIDKAYAFLAARANSQTLYLSRPSEKQHQSIYYGKKGSTHFTCKEITAVNQFHNAMVGQDEKVLGGSTYYAVLRTGGAVIVAKENDTDVSVTNSNTMVPAGTYTDKITGSTFTVTDKTITGHVGSSGIAVIYDGTPQPTVAPTQAPTQAPTTPPTQAPTEPARLLGDIDGDEDVSVIDVTLLQRKLAGIDIPYVFVDKVADADEDDDVTVIDVTYIQRWLAGIPSNDNIGKPIT